MFAGGIVTVYVTEMDRSVRFYTEQLGLTLLHRYQNHFATIDADHGLIIGLHPTAAASPAGTKSGMSIGLYLTRPISEAVSALEARGVKFVGPVINEGKAGTFAHFSDPDGNSLYVAEMKQEYRDEAAGVR